MKLKYIALLLITTGLTACNDLEDVNREEAEVILPALTSGTADFSTYVSLGNSLTAGYTDNALFIAAQENSIPNILASKFALAGGGEFKQPLMNDNYGGLAYGGTRIAEPRLVFNGSGPASLESVIGSINVSTDLALNNPTGPFNNMGVPGAKSYHLLYDGLGNPSGLLTDPMTANPYFVRMASSTSATVLGDAMAQSPTFFSLWIGNNDVLGYALSGGDGSSPITPLDGAIGVGFTQTYGAIIATLTSQGAKGVVANIPDVISIPHFTTVPHNPIPLDAATAAYLNSTSAYGAYNAGIVQAFAYLVGNGLMTQDAADAEIAKRTITFEAGTTNAVVIMDEYLTDLTGLNPALVSMRQATADDLLVLTASTFIGTEAVPGNPQTVNGVAIPLADKWVLTPEEQEEISTATSTFNAIIDNVRQQAGLAMVDTNSILNQLANGGVTSGDYTLTSNLVVGGAFSLDGVHLTARGYAYLANEFMKAIDATYNSNFVDSGQLVDIGNYPTNYSPTLQ
ncbi:G-D-S-L family lipolytic protein [Aestuariibaculum sp. M13]|uniref:G-D-S-L family lipolytic protein n=1 Tax=Aestuariibaculum sp. M13 TaxID=2967132 RepID=UPI002159D62E|nr:G-D-S-L family lipolytic protein [Aestuariibaculum sp. M13]MCR8667044.1 G-D-S-L family lipolytic protein [Aestuariibaculum sp. M13]